MTKVLITGDKGYIGSKLKVYLKKKKIKILLLKKKIDINVIKINKSLKPNIVVHLAAKTNVLKSWDQKNNFILENISSTKYILDYCVKNKSKLIFISSYLYGNTKKIPTDERGTLKTLNPYALSKKMCEDMCNFYNKNYGLDVIIIRPFNIYGPGQNDKWLIPNIINQAKNSNQIVLNSVKQKRDYVYIDDFSDLIYTLIVKNIIKGTYNLGTGKSYSIKKVINIIQKLNNTKKPIISRNIYRKNDVVETKADVSKLIRDLGWKPKWTLTRGLEEVLKK